MSRHFDFQQHLDSLARSIAKYLSRALPQIGGSNWWRNCVIDVLTAGQVNSFSLSTQPELERLDLRALLRVLDRNWFPIASQNKLAPGLRTWAREVVDIRNVFAHKPSGGAAPPLADSYRILETITRVQSAFSGGQVPTALTTDREDALQRLAASAPTVPEPGRVATFGHGHQSGKPTLSKKSPLAVISSKRGEYEIGGVRITGPTKISPGTLKQFDGAQVDAVSSEWSVTDEHGLDLSIIVLTANSRAVSSVDVGELGRVYCQSPGSSDVWWKSITNRLRLGIRPAGPQTATIDLKLADCKRNALPARTIAPLAQLNRALNTDLEALFKTIGALKVGKRSEVLTTFPRKTGAWPAIVFKRDDSLTPVIVFAITTVLPLLSVANRNLSVKTKVRRKKRNSKSKLKKSSNKSRRTTR
jgi:hypothetical protein